MKKSIALLLALMMMLGMLAGCGKEEDKTDGPDDGAQVEREGGYTVPIPEAKSYKKHIVLGMAEGFNTCDPHAVNNSGHRPIFIMIFNRLVSWDSVAMEFKPELATKWEWKDNVTLDLQLRDDVKFHNGEPFTADDVKFTIQHAVDFGTSVSVSAKEVEEVKVLDDYHCQIVLKEPNVDLLHTLALPMLSMINREACEKDAKKGPYIGTGPWMYVDMVENDHLDLKRNDNYWGEIPKTETMKLRYIPEASTRLVALQNHEIDYCADPNVLELDLVRQDKNLRLEAYPATGCTYFCFNSFKGPGTDQNFRLAVAHALDAEELMMVKTQGNAKMATTYWGWNTFGFDETIPAVKHDINKAKEYLAKTDIRKFTVTVINTYKLIAETMKAQLKEAGIEMEIEELQSAAQVAKTKYAVADHEALIYGCSWNVNGDDGRRPYYANSNTNKAVVHDQEIFDLLDDAKQCFDENERKQMYSKIQQINQDKSYYVPLFFAEKFLVLSKNSGGVRIEPNGYHDFSYFCAADK